MNRLYGDLAFCAALYAVENPPDQPRRHPRWRGMLRLYRALRFYRTLHHALAGARRVGDTAEVRVPFEGPEQ